MSSTFTVRIARFPFLACLVNNRWSTCPCLYTKPFKAELN
uniref:Uncharacterized protein n=1 Tax=Rhizophora mucronata TaxID=61149 RepID=A0A2P2R188_RHIMU